MPHMETRRYDAENDKTLPIRMKEEDPDYRFFLDPDLPAFRVEE
jgi:Asp-tRNA(Asn)/Glu-tRNA(Gln) amidotransferase B subunit